MKMIFWFYFAFHLSFHRFASGKLMVTQNPNESHIPKGKSITITCCWNITDSRRIRVEWRKCSNLQTCDDNGTVLSSGLWSPNKTTTLISITKDKAVLTLESITKEDEGLYVCKIISEIPTLNTGQGNGTQLHVNDKPIPFPLWYLYFTILIIIPILITVYCCFYRWKKGKELHMDHTYGNMTRHTRKDAKSPSTIQKKKIKKTCV
ncbi:uncharacterized protein [Pyxicephalus adspersus]|uniref:uncharacterized protein n=1 Tax=Pyxicephalus adspersus TaxID=30357 RepID=UPI003B5CD3DB